ncbi:hypothetical protein TWF281_007505 [Arthrobotrys megalospora]
MLRARKREVLQRLSKLSYQDHKERNPDRIPGTCEWFVAHERFREWKESKSKTLWVSADPGCGKSVLAKYLVDSILTDTDGECRTTCYFFFKDDVEDQKTVVNALRCILHQLFKRRSALLSETILEQFEIGGEGLINSFIELWGTLLSVARDKNAGEIICLLDAIDECENLGRSQLIKALHKLHRTSGNLNLKFLLTSRPYSDIRRDFLGGPQLSVIHLSGESEAEMEKISREIDIFIKARVQDIGERQQFKSEDRDLLLQKLTSVPNRTYLWVYLTLDLIESDIYIDKIGILNAIARVSGTIDEAYERMLSKSRDVEEATKLLQIVIAAARPLSLKEMSLALALQNQSEERFREYIREICGFLIIIRDSRIYLLHQTSKEFLVHNHISNSGTAGTFKWKNSFHLRDSHRVLANICIQHLLSAEFEDLPPEAAMLSKYVENHVFLDYSAKYWMAHLHESQIGFDEAKTQIEFETETQCALKLCDSNSRRCLTWFRIYWTSTSIEFPKNFTTIMIAAYFGFTAGVIRLLEMDINYEIDLDSKDDTYGRSAVSWAAGNGFDHLIELLVGGIGGRWKNLSLPFRKGAQVDSADKDNRTPLVYAVWNGHVAVVDLLLKAGARIDLEDNTGGTPLLYAISSGYHDIVELISKKGTMTNTKLDDSHIATLFSSAAGKGHDVVLKQMLKTGKFDPGLKDSEGRTALSRAAENGYEAIVMLLLETNGLNPDLKDLDGQTPLSYAAREGHEAIIKLLLETGKVDPDSKDSYKRTPLSLAAENGHEAIVTLLLQTGKLDPNSDCEEGWTPFSYAIESRVPSVASAMIQALLRWGARVDFEYKLPTPLLRAIRQGDIALVKLLLENGAQPDLKSSGGRTPLSEAVHTGHETVQLLLESGARLDLRRWEERKVLADATDRNYYKTAKLLLDSSVHPGMKGWGEELLILDAGEKGYDGIVGLFLEKGVQPNPKDWKGRRLLSIAAANGHYKTVKLLLENGARPESEDSDGRIPLSHAKRKEVIELLSSCSYGPS